MPNLESRWWSTVTLLSGFHDYHVRVPRRRLRVGRNELVLRYGNRGNEVPWAGDSVRRSPAVAWQRIRIGSEFAFGSVRADSQALEIPFHTRVDYFVDLHVKAGAKLRWERVVPWGVAPGQAAPTLHADVFYEGSSTPTRVAVLTGTDLAAPFSAALDSHGVARVSFLALRGRPLGRRNAPPDFVSFNPRSPPRPVSGRRSRTGQRLGMSSSRPAKFSARLRM